MVLALPEPDARYRLLEPVRQYAAVRLAESGEADDVADRHTDWVCGLGHEARDALRARDQAVWLDLLEAEHANQRAALERLIARGRLGRAARLLSDTWLGWALRGYATEGLDWTERVRGHASVEGLDADGRAFLELATRRLPVATGDLAGTGVQAGLGAVHLAGADARRPARAGRRMRSPRASRPGASRPRLLLRRGNVRRRASTCGSPRARPSPWSAAPALAALSSRAMGRRAAQCSWAASTSRDPWISSAFGVRSAWSRSARRSRGHPRREHHPLRRGPAKHGRGGGVELGLCRLGGRSAERPRTPSSAPAATALGGEGSSVAPPACWRGRARGRARRGHRAHGPAHGAPRGGSSRAAARPARTGSSSPTGCPRSSGPRWSPSSTTGARRSSRAPASSSHGPGRSTICWMQPH